MNRLLKVFMLIGVVGTNSLLFGQPIAADTPNYLWPTNASSYLTSAFSEYRGRRFHAGIDIKTWGKIGYEVYAIRPAFVWRISVSPFGYGKALYLKLDTGEIAVFAHLSRYSDKIQKIVEREQNRRGQYRINKYLKPGELPVAQGEIVAHTGQTGIGAPHLHFEIRDAGNRPTNPLAKGYTLPDKVSPIVTRLSMSPLDANSEINGDFKPLILQPKWLAPGEYEIQAIPMIWGNVGLAIACYDKQTNGSNRFGLYQFKLFVDDELHFQFQYDKMNFNENRMVELERDYRLYRRSFGRFHKLYKDRHNFRSIYTPNKSWAGVLRSATLESRPYLSRVYDDQQIPKKLFESGLLFPGQHQFRIEVSDFFGNVSTVKGTFHVGDSFDIQPEIRESENQMVSVTNIFTYDLRKIKEVHAFVLKNHRWQPVKWISTRQPETLLEKGGSGTNPDVEDIEPLLMLKKPQGKPFILKIIGYDQFNSSSNPYFYVESQPKARSGAPQLSFDYDYYDDYLRLVIHSGNILLEPPKIVLYHSRQDSSLISLKQLDLKEFVARIDLRKLKKSVNSLKITSRSLSDEIFTHWEQFSASRIKPNESKMLFSEDRNFWITFSQNSLYRPIYNRISVDSLGAIGNTDIVGRVYHAEPQDVPLNQGASITMRYDQRELHPEKLGVYYKTAKGKWVFIDNKLNEAKQTVTAKVFSLEKFALVRDEVPPEITNIRPGHHAHLKSATPMISVNVQDRLSGIASEKDVVIRLDGQRLIAEYDPERRQVLYQVKQPLAKGRHEITVWAQDRLKNDAFRKTFFWID
ncbi:MAG: M23 family metallopeptidase [bacterium]